MSAPIKAELIQLSNEIAQAFDERNWEQLLVLDTRCREVVASVNADEVRRDPDLLLRLKLLVEAYQGLVLAAEEQKSWAANACRKQGQVQRGVKAYMQFQ